MYTIQYKLFFLYRDTRIDEALKLSKIYLGGKRQVNNSYFRGLTQYIRQLLQLNGSQIVT